MIMYTMEAEKRVFGAPHRALSLTSHIQTALTVERRK